MTTPTPTSSSPAIASERATAADVRHPVAAPIARRFRRAVLWGGLAAGVLDIAYVLIIFGLRGASPVRILQGIAGGVLGPAAFNGGAATAALGLALHFVIAFGAATTYALASLKVPLLTRRPILSGSIFGVCVYFFMQLIVLPLSNARGGGRPSLTVAVVLVFVAHIICVGIPIALSTRRAWLR